MNTQTATLEAVTAAPGMVSINGHLYMTDALGSHVPIDAVRTEDRLQDEVVRKIVGYAAPLAAEAARFRAHTFDDVDAYVELIHQNRKAKGEAKGNLTLFSFDGRMKVQVAISKPFSYGVELQAAKSLIDECIDGWAQDAHPNVRALIYDAFRPDKEGNVSRSALLRLLKLDFQDDRWKSAMAAIRDAERVIGSKRYVNIYRREKATDAWVRVAVDLASA